MNGLSVLDVRTLAPTTYLSRNLQDLDPVTKKEMMRRAANWGFEQGMAEVRRYINVNGMGSLSEDQATDIVQGSISKALSPFMPSVQSQLLTASQPVIEQLKQVLSSYMPGFAAITGVVAGTTAIGGMILLGGYLKRALS